MKMSLSAPVRVLVSFLPLLAVACGSSKPAIEPTFLHSPQPTAESVSALNLDGYWSSGCIANPMSSSGTRQVTLQVAGASAEYNVRYFTDKSCGRHDSTENLKGELSVLKSLGNAEYLIQLNIPIDANVSTSRLMRIGVKAEVLFSSELFVSDLNEDTVPFKIQFTKQTPPAEAPAEPGAQSQLILQSGRYRTNSDLCDQVIATQTTGGKITALYLDLQSPCSGQIILNCADSKCESDAGRYVLTILSSTNYNLENRRTGLSGQFEKQ